MGNAGWNIVTPVERVNFFINPIFDSESGYSAIAGAVLSRDEDAVLFGRYSLKVAPTGSGDGVQLSLNSDPSSGYKSLLFYATVQSLTVSLVSGTAQTSGVMVDSSWYEHRINLGSGDLSNTINITQTGSGTTPWYMDGTQVEAVLDGTETGTTLIHGGFGEGYIWFGESDNSPSRRSELVATGGFVRSFNEFYGVVVENNIGSALFQATVLTDNLPTGRGSELNNIDTVERTFELECSFQPDSEFHTSRDLLARALHSLNDLLPRRLIYKGSLTWKYIDCFYTGGLEGGVSNLVSFESFALKFKATDPNFYGLGELKKNMTGASLPVYGFVGRERGAWGDYTNPSAPSQMIIPPFSGVYHNGAVYAGGYFVNYSGVTTCDSSFKYTCATGVYSTVWGASAPAVSIYGTWEKEGYIYMWGAGVSQHIVKCDTNGNNIPDAFGTGVTWGTGRIYTACFLDSGSIFMGGDFTGLEGLNDIAMYDGSGDISGWSGIYSSGSPSRVLACATDGEDVWFHTVTSETLDGVTGNIFRYDVSAGTFTAITALAGGLTSPPARAMVIIDGYLYVSTVSNSGSDSSDVRRYLAADLTGETTIFQIAAASGEFIRIKKFEENSILVLGEAGLNYVDIDDGTTVVGVMDGSLIIRNPSGLFSYEQTDLPPPEAGSYHNDFLATPFGDYILTGRTSLLYELGVETLSLIVSYSGSAKAEFEVEIFQSNSGSLTIKSIKNTAIGSSVDIADYVMGEGETLTLSRIGEALVLNSSKNGDVSGYITINTDAGSFLLSPSQSFSVRDNTIGISYSKTGNASIVGRIKYRPAYLGQD